MTGAREMARRRRHQRQHPAVTFALRYTRGIGQRDNWGQVVPPHVRANARRMIAWAVRK